MPAAPALHQAIMLVTTSLLFLGCVDGLEPPTSPQGGALPTELHAPPPYLRAALPVYAGVGIPGAPEVDRASTGGSGVTCWPGVLN